MNGHVKLRLRDNYNKITPWETNNDTVDIDCEFGEPFCETKTRKNNIQAIDRLPSLSSKRPKSNCHDKQNNQNRILKMKSNTTQQKYGDSNGRVYSTIGSRGEKERSERPDRYQKWERTERPNILQQISVKNFIIEGAYSSGKTENGTKKKESSYILKQKFAEIRRSMNLIIQNRESANLRVFRYQA